MDEQPFPESDCIVLNDMYILSVWFIGVAVGSVTVEDKGVLLGGDPMMYMAEVCWSPGDPGISEATQTYGSSPAMAVIVTDKFLVPSVLFNSTDIGSLTLADLCW